MQKKKWFYQDLIFKSVCCVFLFVVLSARSATGQEQEYKNTKITMNVEEMKLSDVLDTLASKAGVRFFYNHSQIDVNKRITIDMKDQALDYVLMLILGDQPVDVEYQINRVVVLKYRQIPQGAAVFKLRGMVVDARTKEPLPGASLVLKENRGIGVVTDFEGKFFIEVPEGATALVVSFIGYEVETVPVKGNDENLRITLTELVTEIEDVVVTGMAPRKVSGYTGRFVTVKGEELKRLNPNNLLQALQLFDPSFRIVENNARGSDPNALPEFRLRGDVQLGSAGSDASSFQMMMGDYSSRPNMPLFILDGFETTLQQIVDLDPERVESITILKDAAGTAMYGSKASNGVLVFETKKPKAGALTLSYGGNAGFSIPDLSDYNLMNASEKLEYERAAGLFKSVDMLNYYNKYKEEILRGVDTYWLSQPLRTAITHRHTLSMSGGDDAIRYSLTLNYGNEYGVMKKSGRENIGLTLTLQYRRKQWNISNSLNLSNSEGNNSPYGSFSLYTKLNPYYRLTDENGRYQQVIEEKPMTAGHGRRTVTNPLYNTQFPFKDFNRNFTVTDNLSVEYSILDNLRLQGQVSFTKGIARSEQFKSSNHTDFATEEDLTRRGSYQKNTGETVSWRANASLNYNFLKNLHGVFASVRWNVESSVSDGVNLSARGFPNDNMTDFLFAFEMENRVNGNESTRRNIGLLASINYMYDQRYSVDFNLTGDMSSQFGSDTQMAPFWSVGLRWNMQRERWLNNTSISNLALYANIGVTGSQSYQPYQAKETYSFNDLLFPYPSGDVLGAQLLGIGNPDLGWSKTLSKTVSMELGLWNSRMNVMASYYHNYTDEMLLDNNVQPSTGFTTITRNVGAILNEGVEMSVNGLIFNDYQRQIQWMVGVNATHNRNVIKKLSNELKEMNRENLENKSDILPVYEEGQSTTVLKLVPSLGIDPATGKELFLKRNGEKTFVWDGTDKVAVGDTEPDIRGAVTSSLTWKNLSASIGFSFQFGADRFNQTLVDKIENSDISNNVDRRAGGPDRWSETNRYAKYKGMSLFNQETPTSTRFLQKYHEFVFNTISINYRFDPKQFKFLEACRIAGMTLNASMQDIGRISSVKQERGLDYPFARSFNLSLSILFN